MLAKVVITKLCIYNTMAVAAMEVSATDLAREWETCAELRRRATQHQLAPGMDIKYMNQ